MFGGTDREVPFGLAVRHGHRLPAERMHRTSMPRRYVDSVTARMAAGLSDSPMQALSRAGPPESLRVCPRRSCDRVEHLDPVSCPHHHRQVVLDEKHTHAPVVREPADEMADLHGLVVVETRSGLVEQEGRWACRDRAGDRDQPTLTVGQLLRPAVQDLSELDVLGDG